MTAPVAAARRLTRRTARPARRGVLVEGPQAIREALAEPGGLVELFATDDAARRHRDLVAAATASGVPLHVVGADVLDTLAGTVTPQGVVGVAPFRDVPLGAVLDPRPLLVAVLVAVRDPGNAGTILRVADAAGVDAVVFADDSVDPYNPKCVRASAGSLFHLPFVVDRTVAEVVEGLRTAGLRLLAADAAAEADLETTDLSGPTAWLFGNEAWGLTEAARSLADQTVRVPIHGRAESLNLATAAAVCLYASAGAHRRPGGCRT